MASRARRLVLVGVSLQAMLIDSANVPNATREMSRAESSIHVEDFDRITYHDSGHAATVKLS